MVLKKLKYQGFRNLTDGELEFTDDFNFVIGKNGAGKTNLLEAIIYAGLGSSFRIRDERNMIRTGKPFMRIDAQTEHASASVFYDGDRKKLILKGNEIQRLSDFVGWLGIVILSIEDIWIVRGGPSRRRNFLDWTIAKFSTLYLNKMIEYRKILRQRNKILQNGNDKKDDDIMQLFDEQLIALGNDIYRERAVFLPRFKANLADMGDQLGLPNLDFIYRSTCPDMHMDNKLLERMRSRELVIGHTLVGPHRDDLVFSIKDRPLQGYASEGEERIGVISMKLAEAEILHEKTEQRPILMLDEVTAELDQDKTKRLLALLRGQVFYASTRLPEIPEKRGQKNRFFTVERGNIEISTTYK
jgi:DNA replication and repair protein RecF